MPILCRPTKGQRARSNAIKTKVLCSQQVPQRRFQRGGSRVRCALMIFAAPHLDSWLAGHLAADQSGDKN